MCVDAAAHAKQHDNVYVYIAQRRTFHANKTEIKFYTPIADEKSPSD